MNVLRTIPELRARLTPPRREGRSVGLVPTMGAFHEGHVSLMRAARSDCDVVVVSLFVNPIQFNDSGDLAAYPRDERRDAALAEELGVDVLFAPSAAELYPPGFATTVSVHGLTDSLEGAVRGRQHFDGVATVVTKLLNIVGPDAAYFGQKDAQQAIMIRRLVRDLELPVEIRICPTVRAGDGLALSSRNAHLSPRERLQATCLSRALGAVRSSVLSGQRDPDAAIAAGRAELAAAGVEPEYLSVVDADTIDPVARIEGDVIALVAARVGSTRLIDNMPIRAGEIAGEDVNNPVATLLDRAPTI